MSGLDPDFAALLSSASSSQPTSTSQDATQSAPAPAGAKPYTPFASWANWMPKPLQQFTAGAESAAPYYYDQARKSLGLSQNPGREAAEAQAQQPLAGKIGNWAASALLGAPIAAGAALAAPEAGIGALGGGLLGAIGGGAAQGALLSPAGSRGENALLGAATGGLLHGAGAAAGKLVSGMTRTPAAQTLLDRSIPLTPGQMNPTGLYNKVEQGLTAIPFVGGKIANARAAGVPAFTRGMLEDALAPGDTLGPGNDLNELYAGARAGFDNAYDSIHGYPMKPAVVNIKGPDVPLSQAFQQITDKPRLGLTATQRASMGQQLQDQLGETIAVAKRSGGLLSDHLQQLRSAIRDAARDVSPVDNASRAQRGFWDDAEQQVTKALDSQLPPKASSDLKAIDAQYGKLATIGKAIGAAKDRPEGPTLQQFSTAIKNATPASTYAAGGGWNRDAAKAAQAVFGSTVPMTGLTGAGVVTPLMRGVEGGLGLGAGALGLAHPVGLGAAALGTAGLLGGYTAPGLRALAGQTAPQKAVQGLLKSLSPQMRKALPLLLRAGGTQASLQGLNGGLLSSPQPPQ
jgi:hypothetical protein